MAKLFKTTVFILLIVFWTSASTAHEIWTKVEDYLPQHGEWVIVYRDTIDTTGFRCQPQINILKWEYEKHEIVWRDNHNEWYGSVTHWKVLPRSPHKKK